MYSRSSAPRSVITRSRRASSSRPRSSTCSAVSTTSGLSFLVPRNGRTVRTEPNIFVLLRKLWSDLDFDVSDGRRNAQLDRLIGVGVGLAGAHVAGAARLLDRGAGEADTHAAAVCR